MVNCEGCCMRGIYAGESCWKKRWTYQICRTPCYRCGSKLLLLLSSGCDGWFAGGVHAAGWEDEEEERVAEVVSRFVLPPVIVGAQQGDQSVGRLPLYKCPDLENWDRNPTQLVSHDKYEALQVYGQTLPTDNVSPLQYPGTECLAGWWHFSYSLTGYYYHHERILSAWREPLRSTASQKQQSSGANSVFFSQHSVFKRHV